jgi:glycosyltransferase involved in cell wall biosynthesis
MPGAAYLYKFLRIVKHQGLKTAFQKVRQRMDPQPIPCETTAPLSLSASKPDSIDAKVSVIIPAYNGGGELPPLLEALKSQKKIGGIEIIVVDSGSRDDTVQCAQDAGAEVICIAQEEFSHSYSRNLGAASATGEYFLFMTQDAMPTGEEWLYHLLCPIVSGDAVAVSCAEQVRDDCELSYRIDSDYFIRYLGVSDGDRLCGKPQKENYESLRKNGQLNDVACVIRRDVFEQYRYRGDYAEDLDLGVRLIRDGYRIALLSSERVIHSHNRPCGYSLKRAFVDGINLRKILPDFPLPEHKPEQIASGIMTAFQRLGGMAEGFADLPENTDPWTFFSALNRLMDRNAEGKLRYGMPWSDDTLDGFIEEIYRLCPVVSKEEFVYFDLRYYERNYIRPYVEQHYPIIDAKLKQEIISTLFKRFAVVSGNEVCSYCACHPEDNLCSGLAKKLQSGV